MVQYRYHRMAANSESWRKPHAGRLGRTNDYVGATGFGHEDWNFSFELWEDGKCHLYLRSEPAQPDRGEIFNIALGIRSENGHQLVGFCENATYSVKNPTEDMLFRRAEQLHELDLQGQLGGRLRGLSVADKAATFAADGEVYWVAVAPEELFFLTEPMAIPPSIIDSGYNRYGLRHLGEDSYAALRTSAAPQVLGADLGELDFPEGAVVARKHLARERDISQASLAKKGFMERNHGSLFCESCRWRAERQFPDSDLQNLLIEVHHDVPLGAKEHLGRTRRSDLRMLCPNCHRAIHRIRPWHSVDQFKARFFPD